MKGKFIVLYGINNLGKSTQAELLIENLKKRGLKAEYLKYARYDLEPSGPIISDYLRKGNPHNLTPRELQLVHVINRSQYEPTLKQKLKDGINIIAEDYVGTGLAWGIGTGVSEDFMKCINSTLIKEDIAFHFVGERFTQAIEKNHKFEENNELMMKVKDIHAKLGKERKWIDIDANKSIEEIQKKILTLVLKEIE